MKIKQLKVFEPLMREQPANGLLVYLFGETKGLGAAMLFSVIGAAGILVCFIFNFILKKYRWSETVFLDEQINN